jgi:[citrate (pro-3S)-lyase] ligase
MNANPFTLGHQYLVEQASKACDILHLFIVSEDSSLVPFSVRKKLVIEGTTLFPNIIYHDSGSYIISSSTFPAYFQKDADAVIDSEARLDTEVFAKIAGALAVTERFAGTEPTSVVTSAYNKIMGELLPTHGITFHEIPRK